MAKHKKNEVAGELTHYTRWATWERDVLSKVVNPAGIQKLVQRRQREIDDDATEMALVRSYFRDKIAMCGKDAAMSPGDGTSITMSSKPSPSMSAKARRL